LKLFGISGTLVAVLIVMGVKIMKILITGSAGLIGSALSKALGTLGVEVLGMDKGVAPYHADCGNILDYQSVLEKVCQVDGVVHLAAVSRVITGEKDPKLCLETNVGGTKHVLEAALESARKPWVLISSSREVYGQQDHLLVKETAPLIPVNVYGESKIAAENAVHAAVKRGLKGSIVRFSNVFGSIHDYPDRVVPAFCRAAVKGVDIRVDGSENLFDFTYLEDVIQGILAFIFSLMSREEPLPPIHLTSGLATSLGEIALFAQQVSSHEIKVSESPSRQYDVATFSGDTTRARQLLNWQARVSVYEGMSRLMNQLKIFNEVQQPAYANE
jgi:UDP-glucose 4-epimerase